MKAAHVKGSRCALAIAIALMCAVVLALPILALAGEESGKEAVIDVDSEPAISGPVEEKPAAGADKKGVEEEKPAAGADKKGVEAEKPSVLVAAGDNGNGTDNGSGGNDGNGNDGNGDNDNQIHGDSNTGGLVTLSGALTFNHDNNTFSDKGQAKNALKELHLGGLRLQEGSDYRITGYEQAKSNGPTFNTEFDDLPDDAEGSYYAIVEGIFTIDQDHVKHGCEGKAYAQFEINNTNSSGGNINNLQVIVYSLIYTGQPASGNVVINQSVQGGPPKSLKEGTDFVVEYQDKSGKKLDPAPSAIGEYQVLVTGIGNYEGTNTVPFTIDAANDIGASGITANSKPMDYACTGQPVVPSVKIVLNGATLVQGKDFDIVGYERNVHVGDHDEWQATSEHSSIGHYRALLKGKGSYIGDNTAMFNIVDPDDPTYWTLSFRDTDEANPTVTLTDSGATPPAVVVKDLLGNVRTEYKLTYFKATYTTQGGTEDEVSALDTEGYFKVAATYSGQEEQYKGRGIGQPKYFYVSLPEHDLTKATVTMPSTFSYKNGASLKNELNTEIVLTLNGKKLVIEKDYYRGNDGNGLDPDRYSGTLGIHKVTLTGNANYPNHTGETYYGQVTLSYGVWNESAPAADTRVDTATGVKAVGTTISENSTFEKEKWVTLSVAKPTGADLDDEAKKAGDAAKASGAQDVQVYDVKLAQATTLEKKDGSEQTEAANLTEGLDVTLTFPVDAKYNGCTATIAQIHDGVALPAKTVTVTNGSATASIDSLSQFVVSVTEPDSEPASAAEAADDSAKTKGADAKATASRGSSKTSATGDSVNTTTIEVIAVIAIAAAVVMFVSRRRSSN